MLLKYHHMCFNIGFLQKHIIQNKYLPTLDFTLWWLCHGGQPETTHYWVNIGSVTVKTVVSQFYATTNQFLVTNLRQMWIGKPTLGLNRQCHGKSICWHRFDETTMDLGGLHICLQLWLCIRTMENQFQERIGEPTSARLAINWQWNNNEPMLAMQSWDIGFT